jgi:hypothetical protein
MPVSLASYKELGVVFICMRMYGVIRRAKMDAESLMKTKMHIGKEKRTSHKLPLRK